MKKQDHASVKLHYKVLGLGAHEFLTISKFCSIGFLKGGKQRLEILSPGAGVEVSGVWG